MSKVRKPHWFPLLGFCLLALCALTGCASFDPITYRNAVEARDTIEKYLDPALPDSAKTAAKEQAKAWVEYEEAKK